MVKPLTREMVLPLSRGVRAEVSEEGDFRVVAEGDREDPAGAVRTGRDRLGGGARAPVPRDTAKVQRGQHGGISQG